MVIEERKIVSLFMYSKNVHQFRFVLCVLPYATFAIVSATEMNAFFHAFNAIACHIHSKYIRVWNMDSANFIQIFFLLSNFSFELFIQLLLDSWKQVFFLFVLFWHIQTIFMNCYEYLKQINYTQWKHSIKKIIIHNANNSFICSFLYRRW